jgi:DNA-directed RNA polymerase subunit RPC12/RpoP
MMAFICEACREGFDIEISGGIDCPECGNRKWASVRNLPNRAMKYRLKWMKEFDVFPLNEDEEPGDYFNEDGTFREGSSRLAHVG